MISNLIVFATCRDEWLSQSVFTVPQKFLEISVTAGGRFRINCSLMWIYSIYRLQLPLDWYFCSSAHIDQCISLMCVTSAHSGSYVESLVSKDAS